MDGFNSQTAGGSLQISTGVLEKIAKHAAMEVEGVAGVVPSYTATKSILGLLSQPRPVNVSINSDVADIEVSLLVNHGTKIRELSEKVQQSVKEAVQSMTNITVARVDVVVAGLCRAPVQAAEADA